MTKTNYKLIAKNHLKNLEKEYEELKIKNKDEYYEDDYYICTIADLENLIESNGQYTIKRTYEESPTIHYMNRNNFDDLNEFDYKIEKDLERIEKAKKRIEENKILKTEKLRDILNLEDSQIKKIKNTFTYDYFTEKEKRDKFNKVTSENRKRFFKNSTYV
tara:strand:+ start:3191 stop:3673 length:483 start_codon:yes stop_codon:yes gene_type:complete